VACRYPKTRSAAEASSPSASAANTTAIWWEGVFSRYKGVWRLAVNVVHQSKSDHVAYQAIQWEILGIVVSIVGPIAEDFPENRTQK